MVFGTVPRFSRRCVLHRGKFRRPYRNEIQGSCGKAFREEIGKSIEGIRQMNAQIATAAEEQSQVSLNIDKYITNIAQVAQNNTQSVAKLSATGEQLKTNVQQLDQ